MNAPRPLANRVDPFGALVATQARGTLYGNCGGRFHSQTQSVRGRPWAGRQWICCVLDFKGRRHDVWGRGFTDLFFLDEVTALAAGHRPCFECRRADAKAFQAAWADKRVSAPDMDRVLHAQRLDGRAKRMHRLHAGALPDGAVVARNGVALALREGRALAWSFAGYSDAGPRPQGEVDVLTPPAILHALKRGYAPGWHESASGARTSA